LRNLSENYDKLWDDYLNKLKIAGHTHSKH